MNFFHSLVEPLVEFPDLIFFSLVMREQITPLGHSLIRFPDLILFPVVMREKKFPPLGHSLIDSLIGFPVRISSGKC